MGKVDICGYMQGSQTGARLNEPDMHTKQNPDVRQLRPYSPAKTSTCVLVVIAVLSVVQR